MSPTYRLLCVTWRLIPRRWGFLGRLMVCSYMLTGGCRIWFLMCTPLDRQRFCLRMIGMLLALSASCIFPLQLHASLPWTSATFLTDEHRLSQSEASCCHDWWLISACASCLFICLCNAFLEHHNHAFLLGVCWRRLLWACICLPSLWQGQPSAAAP